MKNQIWKSITLVAVLIIASTAMVWAVPQGCCPCCQTAVSSTRQYNVATETTLTGTITEVKQVPSRRGAGGVHLIVQTDSGSVTAHLGPNRFLTANKITLAVGATVKITGSKLPGETVVVIARELHQGDQMVVLRDENGRPKWAGQGNRGRRRN